MAQSNLETLLIISLILGKLYIWFELYYNNVKKRI